jgi:hypothetical protein
MNNKLFLTIAIIVYLLNIQISYCKLLSEKKNKIPLYNQEFKNYLQAALKNITADGKILIKRNDDR